MQPNALKRAESNISPPFAPPFFKFQGGIEKKILVGGGWARPFPPPPEYAPVSISMAYIRFLRSNLGKKPAEESGLEQCWN